LGSFIIVTRDDKGSKYCQIADARSQRSRSSVQELFNHQSVMRFPDYVGLIVDRFIPGVIYQYVR
jgi:hypothetical protein